MPRGIFITFEGLDGSGKTTQLKRLADWLRQRGHDPVVTRQPGGTATGDRIRELLLDSRASAIAEVIEPALKSGRTVLCDRWTDSTEAYQGGGRKLGSQAVLDLHRLLCGGLQPDLTVLLLPPLTASLKRARRRNNRAAKEGPDENRFEREQDAFYRRVSQKYKEIAARDSQRILAIEGDLTIEEVHQRIVAAVSKRLKAVHSS